MIKSGAFAYGRFRVTEGDLSANRIEDLGNFVIGVPQGQLPEFEQPHTPQEWQEILRRILTETEKQELQERLGRAIKPETEFTAWPITDETIILKEPMFQSPSGRRFWAYRKQG